MTGSPNVLEFRSPDTTHRPAIEAPELTGRYAAAGNLSYYPPGGHVAAHPGLHGDWEPLAIRTGKRGPPARVRMAHEAATFREVRERLRCKEIRVVCAGRWRSPDEDLLAGSQPLGSLASQQDPAHGTWPGRAFKTSGPASSCAGPIYSMPCDPPQDTTAPYDPGLMRRSQS